MRLAVWFIILLLTQACAPPKVIKFLNDELDYSTYHTYHLIHYKSDDKSFSQAGLALYNDIESAIAQNMKAKGYEMATKSDLIARYEIVSTIATSSNSNNYDPYGYGPYYAPPIQNTKKYTEGVVLIELRDKKQKKLVWQGSLDMKYNQREETHLQVLQAINRIFETYPYVAGSNEKIIAK